MLNLYKYKYQIPEGLIMVEIWKPIQYEGYYISNFGRVKSYKVDKVNGKIMTPYKDTKGYLQIDISLDGRKRQNRVHLLVHRLVAEAFLPKPPDYYTQVNHKDENKLNNHVDNLEWCTPEYNCNYGNHKENVANAIRKDIYSIDKDGNIEYFHGIREAGRILRHTENAYIQIMNVLKRRRLTAFGRQWFYV